MQRTEQYSGARKHGMQDVETWLANSLATILAGLAVAAGVIGMLMVFGYINEDSTNPFQDGLTWMVGGLILAICANVFRREHHVVDDSRAFGVDYGDRGSMRGGTRYDTSRQYDEGREGRVDQTRYDESRYDDRPYEEPRRGRR